MSELPPIGILPNTGHHYLFVPLPQKILDAHPELATGWEGNTTWRTLDGAKWIRYRPGRSADQLQLGYWVVVDSNLGRITRGFIREAKTEVTPREVAADFHQHDTPYICRDSKEAGAAATFYLKIPIEAPQNPSDAPKAKQILGELELPPVVLQRPAGEDAIDVDLVVDFGNTRTVAVVLEKNRTRDLSDVCRPVRFLARGTTYEPFVAARSTDDPCVVVDSWIVLHEPMFADFMPDSTTFEPEVEYTITERKTFLRGTIREITHETKYTAQMFMELSPVLLGGGNGAEGARSILRNARVELEANYFLSSPKRYAWDSNPVGTRGNPYWHMELNRWNPAKRADHAKQLKGLPELEGAVLMFMDPDGRHWDFDNNGVPPNERPPHERPLANGKPTHPRRDALTWAALQVLETAFRQINSQVYRQGRQPLMPRRLHSVLVTHPSGWTSQELEHYRLQWQKAINIFTLGHLQDRRLVTEGGDRPVLMMTLDEAVASQLPIIYSDIRLMPGGESWFELVGRGQGNDARVRVMNIDIGGGTTDVSVVEYRDAMSGTTVNLESTLLFKNSDSVAGDALVKRIIESVLLPLIGAELGGDAELKAQFELIFSSPKDQWKSADSAFPQRLTRIVRLTFIPIINYWFRELAEERYGNPNQKGQAAAPEKMRDANGEQLVDLDILDEFNGMVKACLNIEFDVLKKGEPLNYDQSKLRDCIATEFGPLFRSLSNLTAAFDCDLVLVSGKPSELPELAKQLQKYLPVLPQRIIFAKDYPVGDWYPIGAEAGAIQDAKTTTVVGAALSRAMLRGQVDDWHLAPKLNRMMMEGNYWGQMPPRENPALFDKNPYLKPDASEWSGQMQIGARIGRKRFLSPELMPDQVYKLRWKDDKRFATKILDVKLQRVSDHESGEMLRLAEVSGTDEHDQPVSLDDVELQLCTLADDEFWMDNPKFSIEWPPATGKQT